MRNLSVIFLMLLIGNGTWSQQTTSNSPYSSFGLGEFGGLDHAVLSGIGNTNITMLDSTFVNFYNPASYSYLAEGQPIFTVGVSSRLSNYSENSVKYFNSVTSVQHFAIAFPFAKRFGLGFGLKPYSRRGYEFDSRIKIDNDSLYYNYSGSGGINEGFLGFSVDALHMRKTRVTFGGNFGVLFGNVSNTRKSGLIESNTSSYSGGVSIKTLNTTSFHYELGAHYFQKINNKHALTLSVVADPLQNIKGDYEDGLYYAADINNPNGYDTLTYNDSLTGNVTNVPSFTYGLSYTWNFIGNKETTKEINSELSFHLSYSQLLWSQYTNRFDANYNNPFLDGSKLTFGIQYVPETEFIVNKVTTKFYHRMRYRIGTYYYTLPYTTNGEQVTDFGTTFGLGIPIVVQNSISSINLGFTYGNRGTSDSQALKEQYYGINIGISIAPGTDRWFRKRKLN